MRARGLVVRLAVMAFAASSIGAVASASPAPSDDVRAVIGAWSTPFDLQVIGIHAAALPGGKVLLFHRPQLAVGSDARVWDPVTGALTDVSFTSNRDIFCAGQTVLSDGRVLVTGGHVHNGSQGAGVKDTDLFDPITQTWASGPLMANARWYPTNIELGDGRVLIVGGTSTQGVYVQPVEVFDPLANTITTLPSTADKNVNSYPRVHLLPSGLIAKVGTAANTFTLDPGSATWKKVGTMLYGKRNAGASVLLPGLSKVLTFGGTSGTTATNSAEILDFSQPTLAWRYTGSLTYARQHVNAVLLPDGKVLAVGGGTTSKYDNPVFKSEMYDPASENWSVMAAQLAPRMYHSTAVLLPDGRVLSAGQDRKSSYSYTGEIYSPPYLFSGARPVIDQADPSVIYGGSLSISTANAASITRVALVRPGAVTHSVDFDQRYVDLSWTVDGQGHITATAPQDGNTAPPGWYMLFVMNGAGVPSVASWVHVGTTLVAPLPRDTLAGSASGSTSLSSQSGYPLGLPGSGSRGIPSDTALVVIGNEDSSSPSQPGFAFKCSRRKLERQTNA